MTKVCYFTSKDANDIRVFHKECVSLTKAGYDVTLVCPNAKDCEKNGVHIKGVKYEFISDWDRFTRLPKLLFEKALEYDADIYHFNDPASIKYGAKLKELGKKVIFDAFEDHPSMWMNRGKGFKSILYKLVGMLYKKYELSKCKQFDAIFVCYHWTKERLKKVNPNVELVLNFPIVEKNESQIPKTINASSKTICYAGTISEDWNIPTVIDAIDGTDIKFNLAGWCDKEGLHERMEAQKGWDNVNFMGKLSKQEVVENVYKHSDIGIALYHYSPLCHGKVGNMSNNKLFEYMLMGMPVVCTDFDLWKEVVEENHCGICVNPSDIQGIRKAIEFIYSHPEESRQMGENGKKKVLEVYNWESQEEILLRVYKNLDN